MKIFNKILDVFFPSKFTCDLCGREIFDGGHFCKDCADTIEFNDGETCPKCGRKTIAPGLCLECKQKAPLYDKAVSAIVYSDGGRTLVQSFKIDKPYLKDYFAQLLLEKCTQFSDAQAVCFVPMTKKDEHSRGFNQSYLLAKELAALLKLPLLKSAIGKVKKTRPQKSLTRSEREENLKSVFKANKEEVNGKALIVVDDVLTTGATADAICAELKKCGAAKVYFVTVASVEYHDAED